SMAAFNPRKRGVSMRIASRVLEKFVLLAFVALVLGAARPATAASKNFIALLNGGQETPANDSDAFGVAFLTFNGKDLCYSITFSSLSTRQLSARLHGSTNPGVGAPGSTADVLFTITETGKVKNGCWTGLKASDKKALAKGQLYVNVHSNQFPNGEIRGQVVHAK